MGSHILHIVKAGFPSSTATVQVFGVQTYPIDLVQIAAAAQRERSQDLERANNLYQSQQYEAAIAACDAVLATNPNDPEAIALKKQIQQTQQILGGHP